MKQLIVLFMVPINCLQTWNGLHLYIAAKFVGLECWNLEQITLVARAQFLLVSVGEGKPRTTV